MLVHVRYEAELVFDPGPYIYSIFTFSQLPNKTGKS